MSDSTLEAAMCPEQSDKNHTAGVRILLLSSTRPSRSLRFASRIVEEVPGVQICGIAQQPLSELSPVEHAIAHGKTMVPPQSVGFLSKGKMLATRVFEHLFNGMLWFIHACPRLRAQKTVTATRLREHCSKMGWVFLETSGATNLTAFVRRQNPNVIVALGDAPLPDDCDVAWIRVRTNHVGGKFGNVAEGVQITVEHGCAIPQIADILAVVTLPVQPYDSTLGFKLKTDLISDDLLLQCLVGLGARLGDGLSGQLTKWTEDMLAPYFAQLSGPLPVAPPEQHRQWYRSVWSLCFDTMVLCSPFVIGRNWIRRMRGRYPVLILTHHLVSDRKHRMGMSTTAFWRQVHFLQRHYNVVSLSEAVNVLKSGKAASPMVSLTFDDGYADNFVSLRAVAEETGISVTLFIATEPVRAHSEFQHDVVKGNRGAFPMTWNQIRYWRSRGAEFGSHTRTHVKCGLVDQASLHDEIVGSKGDLERELGSTSRFFAFPYGDPGNMPPRAVKVASAAYDYFLSSYGGENRVRGNPNRTHLFRKNAFAEPWELELELQSIFDFVETIKRFFHPVRRRRVLRPALPVSAAPLPQQDAPSLVSTNQIN